MTVSYSKNFIKEAKKLNKQQRQKLLEHIEIFNDNPLHPALRNHQLKGKYKAYRSIDVTGGVRALYVQQDGGVIFDTVGTHSQLYG